MTDMTDRLDEIRARLHAWTHWQRAAGKSVEETHVPDMEWLLSQLAAVTAERDFALEQVEWHKEELSDALARLARLEGALGFYADVNNWFLEKTYTGAGQICVRGNDRSDVDQGDEVYTCGGRRARTALSQSPGAELAAVRQAQALLYEIRNQACVCDGVNAKLKMRWLIDRSQDGIQALRDAFGEGEGE